MTATVRADEPLHERLEPMRTVAPSTASPLALTTLPSSTAPPTSVTSTSTLAPSAIVSVELHGARPAARTAIGTSPVRVPAK